MPVRTAQAVWKGTLKEGAGRMQVGSKSFDIPFSFATRFEEEPGTNPEELIGAANAGCFSMFLSALLTNAGYQPTSIETSARVHLGRVDNAPTVTTIELNSQATVPGLSNDEFQKLAADAKNKCPISKALAGVDIKLEATLLS